MLGNRCGGFAVKFVDDFVKDGFTRLVAIDFDEETKRFVMLEYGNGLGAKFLEAIAENV